MFVPHRRVLAALASFAALVAACSGGDSGRVVEPPLVSLRIGGARDTVHNVGESISLTLSNAGQAIAPSTAVWSTSNPGVLSVTADGTVRSEGNGTARVVARWSGAADSVTITVHQVVKTVALTPTDTVVKVGDTYLLSAIPRDSLGSPVPGTVVHWSVANPVIAAVSGGAVEARGVGRTGVTATISGISATVGVGVVWNGTVDNDLPVLTSVAVSPDTLHTAAGQTDVTVTVTATDASSGIQLVRIQPVIAGGTPFACMLPPFPVSGELRNGTWVCKLNLAMLSGPGTYGLTVGLSDVAFHYVEFSQAQVAAVGKASFVVAP